LKALFTGNKSKLFLVNIESFSFIDPHDIIKNLETSSIHHIDIIITNAGVSPPVQPLEYGSGARNSTYCEKGYNGQKETQPKAEERYTRSR
jgi:hypothetical protein